MKIVIPPLSRRLRLSIRYKQLKQLENRLSYRKKQLQNLNRHIELLSTIINTSRSLLEKLDYEYSEEELAPA